MSTGNAPTTVMLTGIPKRPMNPKVMMSPTATTATGRRR